MDARSIEGFVCEMFAAEGQFAIGVGRTYDQAEDFCEAYYGGHLAKIRNQADYDKIADLARGYTQPLMIGLHSDGAGNWVWADGTAADMVGSLLPRGSQTLAHPLDDTAAQLAC